MTANLRYLLKPIQPREDNDGIPSREATDDEMAHLIDPGPEMRPFVDLIVRLRVEHAQMRRGREKYAMGKKIKLMEDDFVRLFNRDDCWEQYNWDDGLTVRFVGPSESGGKVRGRVRMAFSWPK